MPIINQVVSGGGTTPTGTINITTNGTHDVTNYATADVLVPTTAPTYYREFMLTGTGTLMSDTTTTHIMDFTGVKGLASYVLQEAYLGNNNISGLVDMSDLELLSGVYSCNNMFGACSGITGVDMSSLTQISGTYCCANMFQYSSITTVNMSSLQVVSGSTACGNMFAFCTGLTSVDISALTTLSGNSCCNGMFKGCSALTSVALTSLQEISGANAFANAFAFTGLTSLTFPSLSVLTASNAIKQICQDCLALTSISFPALTSTSFGSQTTQFDNMLLNVTGCTVHFPSNLQSVIGSWASVTAGFGGTNTTVSFDLPATT